MMTDKRYQINLEFCGYSERKHVVRFCGAWVGVADNKATAHQIQDSHATKRRLALASV